MIEIYKTCIFYTNNLHEECRALNKLYCKECDKTCKFFKSRKEWKRNELGEIERRK